MVALIARRLLALPLLALAAATLVFSILELSPVDPVTQYCGEPPLTEAARQACARTFPTDAGPLERYGAWLGGVLKGDWGWSRSRERTVTQALGDAVAPTLTLALGATAVYVLFGIGLGLLAASSRGGWTDRSASAVGLGLYAVPLFWLALLALELFATRLGWFPMMASSSVDQAGGAWSALLDRLHHLVLPACVLGLAAGGGLSRFVRSGLLQALTEPFARAARARGLAPRAVWLHALRNALLPVITLVGIGFPALLSGSLVIEVIFSWPGIGRLTFDAVQQRDYPVILITTLLSTIAVILGNLIADLGLRWADPRLRGSEVESPGGAS